MQDLSEQVVAVLGNAQSGITWAKVAGNFAFNQRSSPDGQTGTNVVNFGKATIPLPTLRLGGVYGALVTPIDWPWFPRVVAGIGGTIGAPGLAASIDVVGYATNVISDGTYSNGNNSFSTKQWIINGTFGVNVLAWGMAV
jgi:hypothetical protein